MKNILTSFLEKEGNTIDRLTDTSIADTSYALGNGLLLGNIFKKRFQLPSFATLYTNYPLPYSKKPCTDNFENQCAIRLSISLAKSGIDLSYNTNKYAKCSHNHFIRAKELEKWLSEFYLDLPTKQMNIYDMTDTEFELTMAYYFDNKKNGLFFCTGIDGEWSSSHIDLMKDGALMGDAEYNNLWDAKIVKIWELN